MKTLISEYPMKKYVLILSYTEESWMDMRTDLFQLTDCYYKEPEKWRIEEWTYYRYDTGDELVSKKVVEGYE